MTTAQSWTCLGLLAALACSHTSAEQAASGAAKPQAEAAQAPTTRAMPSPADSRRPSSVSLRNPNDGSLRGGIELPLKAPGLRSNMSRDNSARFGTVEVVRELLRAAERVQRERGGLGVTIHDLSQESGGPLPHHASHQSGRDVDVLFYQLGPTGRPVPSVGAFFDPEGKGVDFRDLRDPQDDLPLQIDLPRTWLFLQALIEPPDSSLQRIFVAEHIRGLLLKHAQAERVPRQIIERFSEMSCQPGYPHDDHFHFRFFCAAGDIAAGCRDSEPLYPWWRAKLAEAGTAPQPLLPRRPQAQADVVTHEEARAAAGPLDPEVERWLDARRDWLKRPRTGRPHCR